LIHIQVDEEQRKWDLAKQLQEEKALAEQRKIVVAVQPAVLQIDIVAPKVKNIFEREMRADAERNTKRLEQQKE